MKRYYTITKRGIIIAFAVILALIFCLVVFVVGGNTSETVSSGTKKLPVYSVERTDRKIALSFDAAWGNEDTEELIKILGEHKVKATFFVVGQWVDKFPESVKALANAGHQVQNHSDTHPYMTSLSREEMKKEVESCNKKIEKITGVRPTLFRPPYGDYDNAVVDVLTELGMHTIQWSVDSLDWKELSADQITSRVLERLSPGSIVLFHNAAKNTPQALPAILDSIEKQKYEPVLINELIYKENYEIDPNGVQKQRNTSGSESSR